MFKNALKGYHTPTAYHHGESEDLKVETSLARKDKGVYIGVQEETNLEIDAEEDALDDIWREMSMAIECSKVWLLMFSLFNKNSNLYCSLGYFLLIWVPFYVILFAMIPHYLSVTDC